MIPWQIEKWLFRPSIYFPARLGYKQSVLLLRYFSFEEQWIECTREVRAAGHEGRRWKFQPRNDFLSSIHPNGSSFLPLICVVLFFCPWGKTDDCSQSSVRSSRSSTQNSQRNVQPFSIYILGFTGNWFEIKMVANYSKPLVTVILRENRGP